MLNKTHSLNVDCVTYDLEDSVTLNEKAHARANIRHFLEQDPAIGIKERAVRINPVGSGLESDDLKAVVSMAMSPCHIPIPLTMFSVRPHI